MKSFFYFSIIFLLISCEDNLPIIGSHAKINYDQNNGIFLENTRPKAVNNILISGHILFYVYNDEYFLAAQKPDDSVPNLDGIEFNERRRKIFNNNFCQYWILKLKSDSLYGPFKKNEFIEEQKKMGFTKILKFNQSTKTHYYKGQREDVQYFQPDTELVDLKKLKGNN